MSSTQVEMCGNNSLTGVPDWPYCLKDHGDCKRFPVFVRSNFGFSKGRGFPLSFASRGFGSNKSTCDGPPDMNRKIIRFAFAGYGGGLTVSGLSPTKTLETISSANNPASPSMPNPLANRRNICRRFNGACQPKLECGLSMIVVYSCGF